LADTVAAVRVLFASTRGAGHLNPLVPLIEACRRRGDEVLVAGPPVLAEAVEGAGYPFWPGAAPPEDELGAVWGRVVTVSREEGNLLVVGEIFGRLNVRAMLPALVAACREWRPDLVLRDPAEFASAVAAEEHGIRHARVGIGLAAVEDQMVSVAGGALEERWPGVAERIRASPYLTAVPGSLEDPETPGPPRTRRFRDPATDGTSGALPDWWAGDERPLVYVTFGTVTGTVPFAAALYGSALAAAEGLDARVLLTVGRETDLDALGAPPPNVRVERWVPQADVFPHASAVVCHGGAGTTLGALAAGLPLVVVPLFADQPENARRVAAVGAGVAVEPAEGGPSEAIRSAVDPLAVRDAIKDVLRNGAYREAAGRLAEEIRGLPPAGAALGALAAAVGR
jgi:UDP:flavonoid glycosyltransferase YjiC (YdhE family)